MYHRWLMLHVSTLNLLEAAFSSQVIGSVTIAKTIPSWPLNSATQSPLPSIKLMSLLSFNMSFGGLVQLITPIAHAVYVCQLPSGSSLHLCQALVA